MTPFVVPASSSFIGPRLLVKEFLLCSFRYMLAYHWSLATTKQGMHWLVSPLLLSSHLQEGWILFSPLRRAGISQQKSPEGCAEDQKQVLHITSRAQVFGFPLTIIRRHHYFVTLVEIRQCLSSILLNMLSVN